MMNKILLGMCAGLGWAVSLPGFTLPDYTEQVVVGRAENWNSSYATLERWERKGSGAPWQRVGPEIAARLGKHGLAWGRGLHPPQPGLQKKEGDGRAPAGVFALGGAYGDLPDVPRRPGLPYHQVTPSDLWVEDVASPQYNQHVILPGGRGPATEWERKQQMKQGDPAHKLKLFIAHNAGEAVLPGAGSAIFFHIWREGGRQPSTGCTVMDESALLELIAWIDPARRPLYVLLPEAEYAARRAAWKLP